jgi:outer membrane protein OmpA-like peptidoglycan-associated protein
MINIKKASLLAALGVMLVPAAVYATSGTGAQDVVKDARGNVVLNTHDNCVVTKWEASADECGRARLNKRDILSRLNTEERTVYFGFNKSTLNASEKAKLDEISSIILSSKEVESVDIVGYADKIGNPSYNRVLSKRRAEAVKRYLATKGLRTKNVSVQGMGENNSVTNCSDVSARSELISCLAADRRVEIMLNMMQ